MADILAVNCLGKFQAINDSGMINESLLRSDMLTKLLVYMLTHREHPVTIQELSEALWQEDETENPTGALKNLMYRLRNILKKTLGEDEYIITGRGAYSWNREVSVVLDAEAFEKSCEKAKRAENIQDRITNYEKAIDIYQGDFMPQILDRHWVVTLSTYYHSMFLSATKKLAELYCQEKRYEDMEHLCTEALKYDMVDEQIHCDQITALMRQNKQQIAMEYYDNAVKILYDALGVRRSAKLERVHKELLSMSKGTRAEDIENVQKDMLEEAAEGAFLCGYPIFREIYRLEARKISRLGEAEYVVLLTLKMKESTTDNEKLQAFVVTQAMKQMEEILTEALRIGDVVAKYSDSQFVILLPTCTYESSMLVTNRIISKFYDKNKGKRVQVKADFEEVTISTSSLVR